MRRLSDVKRGPSGAPGAPKIPAIERVLDGHVDITRAEIAAMSPDHMVTAFAILIRKLSHEGLEEMRVRIARIKARSEGSSC